MDGIKQSFQDAARVLKDFMENEEQLQSIAYAGDMLVKVISAGGKIISFGNGGSMSDAMHFAEEMTGRFREDRPGLPAIAISDSSHMTCAANDYGFENIFSRFIESLGQDGDAVLAISTSGNSMNILKAVEAAKKRHMKVIALTGKDGGQLAGMADVEIRVPFFGYSDRIQEVHIKIIHVLIQYIEDKIFGQ